MRAAIGGAIWQFSTARMLIEYVERAVPPAVRIGLPPPAVRRR